MGIFLLTLQNMKKKLLLPGFLLAFSTLWAQDPSDGMRYAQDNLNGTARFRALSGAMGAIGGDFSALNTNPAGSALFANNQASLTLSSLNVKNSSDYFGTRTSNTDNTLDVSQAGSVWVFQSEEAENPWKKLVVAVNYDNMANFYDSRVAVGHNPSRSIADYFLSYANGIPASELAGFPNLDNYRFQAALGTQSGIIGATGPATYASLLTGSGNYYQRASHMATGFNGKFTINGGASFKDRIFIGVNLNLHYTDYVRTSTFYEDYDDAPGHDADNGIQRLRFDNDLHTFGNGISAQIGIIGRFYDGLRAGISYQTPVTYWLKDELAQRLQTVKADDSGFLYEDVAYVPFPTYRLKTPGHVTGSLAYDYKDRLSLGFDYTIKDYTGTQFCPEEDFEGANAEMAATFDQTIEFRAGAEFRYKRWNFRGGYRFEQSPYKNNATIGNLKSFSTGAGYSFGEIKVDLSYTFAQRDYNQPIFAQGLTDAPSVRSKWNNVSVSVVFEL